MITINNRITIAIKILSCFDSEGRIYWMDKLGLSNSEKGFCLMYLGHCNTL